MKHNHPDGRNRITAGVREVDLHLRPGYIGHDAIDRQLARVRGELRSAVMSGLREIVFVHGQGSGRLRDEIRQIIVDIISKPKRHSGIIFNPIFIIL